MPVIRRATEGADSPRSIIISLTCPDLELISCLLGKFKFRSEPKETNKAANGR